MNVPPSGKSSLVHEAAGIAVVLAYFAALHWLVIEARWPRVTVGFILVPWIIAALSFAWRRTSGLRLAVAIAGVAAVAGVLLDALASRIDATVFVENLAFDAFLASVFASTLRRGRVPLVTRLARAAHGGALPPAAERYSRRVTIAWVAFFVAVASVSTALYVGASREAWSLFVNLLVWPAVGAMFVVEYIVRRIVLRDMEHVSFADTIRAAASDRPL